MAALITIVDPDAAPLCVESIFVDAAGELCARVSGVECNIATRQPLVEAGVVVLQPTNLQLARQRAVFTRLNVSGRAGEFWCVATDHRLVNAAQRFNAMKRNGVALTEQQIWPAASPE